jgi:pimeloyl-ACP methyl ester carboxylesterase
MRGGAHVDARARPPVLVLTGVGLGAAVALRSIAQLKAHFRVLAAPLGDAGDQGLADERFVTAAEDAVALLDAAGVERAHLVGLSFGGVVAQDVAIRSPGRVCSLVLGSSSAGGQLFVPPDPAVRDFLRRLSTLPVEEGLWAAVPYLYAATTCRDRAPLIGEDIARRLSAPLDPRSYARQHAAARAHDTSACLAQITTPTLVIHGEQDRIAPLDNGKRLAGGIAEAQFISLPSGGHAFPTDVPDAGRDLVSFLLAHSRPQARSAARRNARGGRA